MAASPSVSLSPSLSPSVSPSVSLSPSLSPSASPSISPSISPSPADLIYPPTQNGLQKTLGAQLDTGTVASATFNNTTGIQNKKGLFVVDRIDSSGVEKDASVREYITFDGVSGSTVTGLTRGLGGTTDQDHATGAIVEFVNDVVQQQALIDTLITEHATDGTHNRAYVVTPTDIQTLTNKTLTSPTLTTPTISATGFTNAQHAHAGATSGGQVAESAISFTDITTNDVSTTKHGFTPKAPDDATKFLRGDATWAVPSSASFVPIYGYANTSGDQNHASDGSYADITGASCSLVLGAGTYTVVAFANQGCGVSNADTQGQLRIVIGASNGVASLVKPISTSSTDVCMPIHYATGQTGTITVKVQGARQSGSGNFTTYNAHGTLMAIAFPQ